MLLFKTNDPLYTGDERIAIPQNNAGQATRCRYEKLKLVSKLIIVNSLSGCKTMRKLFLFFCVICFACNQPGDKKSLKGKIVQHMAIDSAAWPASFGFGHDADTAMIAKLDIDIRPDGKGLPGGEGNAKVGKSIYAAK